MNRTLKKALASILAMLLLLTAAPLAGFTEIDLPDIDFGITAKAATQGDFDYSVSNGEAQITAYTGSAEVLAIPSELGGYPVTRIGNKAFYDCDNLTSVTIPDSVTNIGYEAFYDCDSLTSITIPDSVTSIGMFAFNNCESLTSVHISDIAAWCRIAFGNTNSNPLYYAKKLYLNDELVTDLVIPDGVTSIGEFAFKGCTSLTLVTIPDSVISIEARTFYECTSLTSVSIPDSVTSIGDSAFENCTSLTSITIPDSVTSIGGSVFNNTAYYNNANNWENNVLYNGNHLIAVKKKISGDYTVKEGTKCIPCSAFEDCTSLTSVTIPDSVTTIESSAFEGCTSLTSVTIPDSVTSIGDCAFMFCTSLTSLTIPNSVTSIGEFAFHGCTSLTSVTIPDSITSIGDCAFENCTSLTSLTIPNSVTSIGEFAFKGCTSLTSVTIPDSVISIEACTFYECTSLASVTIPDSVTSIGSFAFYGCTSLTSVTIPNSVTTIEGSAFYECTSLASVTIPDSVTTIESSAFERCTSLTSVTIPNSVTTIEGSAFYECTSLASVTIPDSITSIGDCAFYSCTSLTSITIPDSVTSIGDYAFDYCSSLTSVTILNPNCFVDDSRNTISSTATIYGYDNSTAQEYAEKYNRTFVVIECDHSETVTIPAKAPTCTEIGWDAYVTCSRCDYTTYQEKAALGHSHKAVVTAPTVTNKGYTTYTCVCGDSYVQDYVDPVAGDNAVMKEESVVGLAGTTAKTLLEQVTVGAKLFGMDGKEKAVDAHIGTGDKLVLPDGTEMILSVLGDLNGDGEIATSDARLALRKAVNLETFNDAQNTAACVDGGAVVEVAHARKILRASVNLEKAEDWFKAMAK